jgi:hypothetical protein
MKDKNKTPSDIFDYLKGKWILDRVINNNAFSKNIYVKGSVVIDESNLEGTLNYLENVTIDLGLDQPIDAYKKYQFVLKDDKRLMQFDCKSDNKEDEITEMYTLDFEYLKNEYPKGTGAYKCNKDIYSVVYDFLCDNKFTVEYTVTGPNKDFSTQTEFTRCDAVELVGNEE